MTLEGVDYAFAKPTGAQLKAAGKRFVVRYLADDVRGLTLAEKIDLLGNGIAICLVYESTADRALSGFSGGQADAVGAKAKAASLGFPTSVPIYFAVDFDASASQQFAIDNYLRGAGSILGSSRIGVYGGYYVCARSKANGSARWFWQTYAWSGGLVLSGAHMLQYNIYAHLPNGIAIDLDRAFVSDFGQFPRPTTLPDTSTGYGLPSWPSYAQTYIGACGYAYRIFVNAGKAPATATTGHWGASGWPSYARYSYTSASQYALRIFKNNPKYRP